MELFCRFVADSGLAHLGWGHLAMILIGLLFIALAIIKDYEPLLL
ncbi:MAG: glutaconyl-CoA decarboxylase subunit beta, partial [Opitutae bacterium]|nr:glutaconyl-CoA decarboxylase subunit beta [Opitutae bacterium]